MARFDTKTEQDREEVGYRFPQLRSTGIRSTYSAPAFDSFSPRGSTGGSAYSGGGSSPQQSAPSQQGSGFVNFDRYFNANRAGAERMGRGYANQVSGQAESARGDLSDMYRSFQQGVNDPGSVEYETRAMQGGASKPPSWLPSEVKRAVKSLNSFYVPYQQGTYTGPTEMGDPTEVGALRQRFGDVDQTIQDAGRDVGAVQTYVEEQARGQPYTEGMGRFDAHLANRGGQDAFDALRQRYEGLSGEVDEAEERAAREIQAARDRIEGDNRAEEERAREKIRAEEQRRAEEAAARKAKQAEEASQTQPRKPPKPPKPPSAVPMGPDWSPAELLYEEYWRATDHMRSLMDEDPRYAGFRDRYEQDIAPYR